MLYYFWVQRIGNACKQYTDSGGGRPIFARLLRYIILCISRRRQHKRKSAAAELLIYNIITRFEVYIHGLWYIKTIRAVYV